MTDPGISELIRVCEEMLARQDRLIARLEAEGRGTSDALWLRTRIMDLLGSIQDAIRAPSP